MKNLIEKLAIILALVTSIGTSFGMDEPNQWGNQSGLQEQPISTERYFAQENQEDLDRRLFQANAELIDILGRIPGGIVIPLGQINQFGQVGQVTFIAASQESEQRSKEKCEKIKELIMRGADINSVAASTPLLYAVRAGCNELLEWLIGAGADVNIAGTTIDQRPLKTAVLKNNLDMAKKLIAAGAELDYLDSSNATVLMVAASRNNLEMVSLLINAGADRTVTNQAGETAADQAIELQAINPQTHYRAVIELLTKTQKIK
ncbi:hypothetical protein BH09DEP1_BH09DEP1_3480 [soil metagenome]